MSRPVAASSTGGYLIRPELRAHIERICHEQELGKRALAYVWGSIDDGPSRKVESLGSNVIVNFHSRKTGLRLMLESRKGELPNAVLLEHDDNVVAFFAQPRSVDLTPVDEDGKARTRKVYTPDFLIVFRDRIVIREARDEGFIIKKNLQNPFHTYRDESTGRWHYRPAENYFADLGLNYEYVCNQSLPGQLVDNMRFLDGHLASDRAPVDANRIVELADAVNEARSISLHELLARGFSADEIYPAIADGAIYFDLENECLSNSTDLVVYADKVLAKVARIERIARQEPPLPVPGTFAPAVDAELTIDGKIFKVVNFGRTDTLLADSAGDITARRTADIVYAHQRGYITGGEATRGAGGKRLDEIGMPALKRAVERLEAVRSGNRGRFSERSMARFQAAVVGAESEDEKLKRLIDQADQRGNRISKITPEGRELIEKTIRDFYDTPQCRTYKGAWDKYVGLCTTQSEEKGVEIVPVSYPTFTKFAAQLTNTKARLGKRAANSIEPIYTSLEDNLPVRGEYPHEVCHIDHTIANMALVSPRGIDLGKPTLTIGVDGCTTHPRAMYLSFDPPSLLQVLMLLRDYVRRHQRLPRILVVDNGSDLRSKGLALFCAIYGIELRFRPPGKARFGNVIERLMGATEVEVFKELEGYTGILKKDARTVTKSVNPFNHACWTLPGLYAVTDWYLFEERPGRIHPVLGMTPNDFEAKRLVETGSRRGQTVHFNSDLLLMTSPHPHRVLHKVDPQRGVWVGGVWFNHPALAQLSRREKVEVRIEPWLRSVVYVHVNNRWVTAVGRFPTWVGQRSSREVDLALREEAKRSTSSAQRSSVSPDKRTSRQLTWRPEAFDPRLHVQQEEARHIYEQLAMTLATPEAEQVAASLGRSTELNQPAVSPPAADVPAQRAQSVEPHGVEAVLEAPASNALADPEPAEAAESISLPPTRSIASATPIAVDPVDAPAPEATAPAAPRPTPERDSALSRISRFH